MSQVSTKEIQEFTEAISSAATRVGNGKVAMDSNKLRELVRRKPDVAKRYVELMCMMAASQPGYLQPALLVAGAYTVEIGDHSLMGQVAQTAEELNATDVLSSIGMASKG